MRTIQINVDFLRILSLCCLLVLLYHLVLIPKGFLSEGYYSFQDQMARYAYDLFYRKSKNPHITVIAVDDKSLQKENAKFPWKRQRFAELIGQLAQHNPILIAFDITFVGESPYGPEDDHILAEGIKDSGNVVLSSYIGTHNEWVMPLESFSENTAAVGFVQRIEDRYAMIRLARPVSVRAGSIEYSFAVKTAALYRGMTSADVSLSGRNLLFGDEKIALSIDATFPIKYIAQPSNFNVISFSDAVKGSFSPSLIKDRIVLVGATAEALHDIFQTPQGPMPGVFISANVIDSLISRNLLNRLDPLLSALGIIICLVFIIAIGLRYSFVISFLATTFIVSILLLLAVCAYKYNLVVDMFGISILLYAGLAATRLFLSSVLYNERTKMLNHLIIDQESGLYNTYYLLHNLHRRLETAQDKRDLPSLILLEIGDKDGVISSSVDGDTKKSIVANVISIMKIHCISINCKVIKTDERELAIMIPRITFQKLEGFVGSLYRRIDNLELFSADRQKRFYMPVAIGICYGPTIETGSAEFMLNAAKEALNRAKTMAGKKVYTFDPENDKIQAFVREKPVYAKESSSSFIDFVVDDLRRKNKQLSEQVEAISLRIQETRNAYISAVRSLVKALEERDVYTAGHSERVTDYALMLCGKLDISEDYQTTIHYAALLHDIGKISTPDMILRKKGELTESEKEEIKKHQMESVKILEPATFLRDTLPLILHHHEHYDGSGYPHGLSGERIPLGARIITIADAYDAMTSGRPYNKPVNTDEAIAILNKEAGKQFDPYLVERFIEALNELKDKMPHKNIS